MKIIINGRIKLSATERVHGVHVIQPALVRYVFLAWRVLWSTKPIRSASRNKVSITVHTDTTWRISGETPRIPGIPRWPVNSPHKRPVTRKMFLFDDVIIAVPKSLTFWGIVYNCCVIDLSTILSQNFFFILTHHKISKVRYDKCAHKHDVVMTSKCDGCITVTS